MEDELALAIDRNHDAETLWIHRPVLPGYAARHYVVERRCTHIGGLHAPAKKVTVFRTGTFVANTESFAYQATRTVTADRVVGLELT
ncbi:hypothetical protein D3C81_1660870 [compost metagenome]